MSIKPIASGREYSIEIAEIGVGQNGHTLPMLAYAKTPHEAISNLWGYYKRALTGTAPAEEELYFKSTNVENVTCRIKLGMT